MSFEIKIDPEEVNKEVAAAVLNSVIGKQLKQSVERYVESIGKYPGYANPVDSAVKEVVIRIVKEEVEKKADDIRRAVSTYLTEELIQRVTEKFGKWLETAYH